MTLVASAAAIPLLAMLPFLLADPHGVIHTFTHYNGNPGVGSLSLIIQPDLTSFWITGTRTSVDLSSISKLFYDHGSILTLLGLAGMTAFLFRKRPPALEGAVLLWLVVYICNSNFFLEYLVWGLPFFIMAGFLRQVAFIQALVLIPTLIFSTTHPSPHWMVPPYFILMVALWCCFVAATVVFGRRIAARERSSVGRAQASQA